MEKFKINSQELIESSGGGNEDIFNAINSPDSHIFSLQRFAEKTPVKITIGQQGGSDTRLFSKDKAFGEFLYDATLGRSTNTTVARSTNNVDADIANSGTIQFAPLAWSDSKTFGTYNLVSYKIDDSHTRIAITGELTAVSNTALGLTEYNYWAGVALNTGTSVFLTNNVSDTSKFFAGATIASGTSNAYTTYFSGKDSYTGLFFALGSSTGRLGTSVDNVFFSGTSTHPMTYSLDFYDVKLAAPAYSGVTDTNHPVGTYVFYTSNTAVASSGNGLLFASETTLQFNNVDANESETYKINGIGVTLSGTSLASTGNTLVSITAKAYKYGVAQSFTGIVGSLQSSVSVAFDITGAGSNTGVNLDSNLYKSSNNSGTVMFSASGTDKKFITLGVGNFSLLNGVGTETYVLSNNASGTFGFGTTFTLDVDGINTGKPPITFVPVDKDGGTVTALASSSDLTINGNFAAIEFESNTSQIGFTFTNSVVANINNGYGTFTFSDTKDAYNSIVVFQTASDLSITGVMSGTGNFNNAAVTLVNSDTTFTLDGTVFSAKRTVVETQKAANQIQFISTTLVYDSTHNSNTFTVPVTGVAGMGVGSNITMAKVSIDSKSAKIFGDENSGYLYVYNSGTGSQTLSDVGGSATNLGAGTYVIDFASADDGSNVKLVGVGSSADRRLALTSTGIATVFLADGGSTTSISNGLTNLTFNEHSDSYVSKLVYNVPNSSISVFGGITLTTGSNTKVTYSLNTWNHGAGENASSTSFVQFGKEGLTFDGATATVTRSADNSFSLTNSGTTFSVTGTPNAADSFTLVSNSNNADFLFGASNTGIYFSSSDTTKGIGSTNLIFTKGAFSNTVQVGSGLINIVDNADSASYRVLLSGENKVAGISGIDSGATLYSVASATTVITNGDGIFTFSSTSIAKIEGNSKGTGTQIFHIAGDANGVTFTLDPTGFVTGISGISNSAVVSITDLTVAGTKKYWRKEGKQLSEAGDALWSNTARGTWSTDKYMGYIVQGSGTGSVAFTVFGIESDTKQSHEKLTKYDDKLGASGASTFGIISNVFNSATQISFINRGGTAFGASQTGIGTLFTNLASNTSNVGVIYQSGTGIIEVAHVPQGKDSATALASFKYISDTVSLTLGDVKFAAGSEYAFSGTGVAVSVDSSIATVAATTDKPAYIGFGDGDNGLDIVFGSGTGIYNIYSDTGLESLKNKLAIDGGGTSGFASGTYKSSDLFAIDVSLGASVTNTYVSGADSALTINDITYAMIPVSNSSTFVVASGKTSGANDSVTVIAGTVNVDSQTGFSDFLGNSFGLGASTASTTLILDAFSYTGVSAATFTVDTASSGTQLARISGGSGLITESVAENSAFVFNNSMFTATSAVASFQVGPTEGSNVLLANSTATGIYNQTGNYTLYDMGSTTFTMNSGSSVVMTYKEGNAYNAEFDYKGGSGTATYALGGTFSLSDWYLSGGVSGTAAAASTIYSYTAIGPSTKLLLTIDEGTETVKFAAGSASRTAVAGTGFSFTPVGADELLKYTSTSTAFTFKIDSATAITYGAQGSAWSGSGTRIYDATSSEGEDANNPYTSVTMYRTFNSDTKFLPGAGATMLLNVASGSGSETFLSGSGTYTANAGDSFHFTVDGNTHSYTSLGNVFLGAYFADANATGTLISASGSGTRLAVTDDNASIWTFSGNGDSFTAKAGSAIRLNINETTLEGSETLTLGTATRTVNSGDLFFVSNDYLSGTGLLTATSYTYKANSTSADLTLLVNGASQTLLLGNVTATRTETKVTAAPTFALKGSDIGGLGDSLKDTYFTFTLSDDTSATYSINSETAQTYGAQGIVWAATGTKTYSGLAIDGSATTLLRTYSLGTGKNLDVYSPASGLATMQVTVADGKGTETFLSGTGTYTAKTGDPFHFAIGNDTVYSYTAIGDAGVILNAYFDSSSYSDGRLLGATGAGTRLTAGTEMNVLMTYDSFTMQAGSTKKLTFVDGGADANGVGLGSETFIGATGTAKFSQSKAFNLSAWYFASGTNKANASTDPITYYASSSSLALTLTYDADGSGTIKVTSGVGTRDGSGSSFTYQANSTLPNFTYNLYDGGGITYTIDASSTSVDGDIYSAVGTRTYGQSSTMLQPVTFNQDTYTLMADAVVRADFVNKSVTETFLSGSATLTVNAGTTPNTFHMAVSSTSVAGFAGELAIYSATAAGATFTISKDALAGVGTYSLVGATGTALTTGVGDTYTINVLSDAFVMGAGTLKELNFAGVEGTYALVNKVDYTSGTGTISFADSTSSFKIADAFILGNGTSEPTAAVTAIEYTVASGSGIALSIDGTNTKITLGTVMGTRTEQPAEGSTFTLNNEEVLNKYFGGQDSPVYSTTGLATYQIAQGLIDSYSSTGLLFAGEGSRVYGTTSSSWLSPVTFNQDTYTLTADAVVGLKFKGNEGTETFTSGSATLIVNTAADTPYTFHAMISGTNVTQSTQLETFSATAAGATFTISKDALAGVGTYSLVGATGTAVVAGAGEHVLFAGSDTYTMDASAIKTLTFGGAAADGTYALVSSADYTSGTGTLSLGIGSSFTVADALFEGTSNISGIGNDKLFHYVASNTGSISLTIDGTNTKIALESGLIGTRDLKIDGLEDSAKKIYFDPDGDGGMPTYTYTAVQDITYWIQSGDSATGKLYSGVATRVLAAGESSTALGLTFNSDTYNPTTGATITLNLIGGEGTETFTAGTGAFTAEAGQGFHFDTNNNGLIEDNEAYTATGLVILGANFVDSTNTSLVSISNGASGTRLSTANDIAFKTFEGAGDSFTMTTGATIKVYDLTTTGASETYISGDGTYTVDQGGYFTVSQDYLDGSTGAEHTQSYTYTASVSGDLYVNINEGTTTLKFDSSNLAGMRTSTDLANTTFELNNYTYSATGDSAAFYISKDYASAEGKFWSGIGTRSFTGGTETNAIVSYLSDTYTITGGTLTIDVNEGTGTETFTAGTATYDLSNEKGFHFALNGSTYGYTDGAGSFTVNVDGTNTTLTDATGTGLRNVADAMTYAVADLGNNVYSFTGVAQIDIQNSSTATEFAYDGKGTRTVTGDDIIFAAFDSASNIADTIYTYTSFADATFTMSMESGTLKTQSIIDGTATRSNATDETFRFVYNDSTYTYTSSSTSVGETESGVGSLEFVLDKETAGFAGAQGGLYSGVGFRVIDANTTYTNAALQITNEYTLNSGDAEFKLNVAGGNGTETLFHAAASNTYADQTPFYYKGTQYTATGTAVMALNASGGNVTEQMASGSATFVGSSSDTTFTWDENLYHVNGSATLILTAADPANPQFVKGTGTKLMDSANASSNTFKYTDGNWYTVTDGKATLQAVGNGSGADVNFTSGTAVDKVNEGDTFNFTLGETSNTYTALTSGAMLGLTGTTLEKATPKFIGGSGTRLQTADGIGTTFTFDNNEYTATADNLTWTISLSDTSSYDSVNEKVTTAEGSRTLVANSDKFTYTSPVSGNIETYTVTEDVTLALKLENNQGTETLTHGAGTRNISAGTTFTLNPSDITNLASDMTFTATSGGIYELRVGNEGTAADNSGLSFMGYNIEGLSETLIEGAGTGTLAQGSTYGFISLVTRASETYTAGDGGVVFDVTVSGGNNTATWVSGSGTMALAADTTPFYYTANDAEKTYTVGADGATFLRTSEDNEYLLSGYGYRGLEATGDTVFTTTYLEDAYTANAGAMIILSSTGLTQTAEGFNSGTATFNAAEGGTFHFDPSNGDSHTYTALTGGVTLTLSVEGLLVGNTSTSLSDASGQGTRAFDANDSFTTTVISNINAFTATEGTYTISFTSDAADYSNVSETLTAGTATYDVGNGNFVLNDTYLGLGSSVDSYTYTATATDTKLTYKIGDDIASSITLSGAGTRTADAGTQFDFAVVSTNTYNYTATNNLTYAISAESLSGAAGYLKDGVGTRLTAEGEGGSAIFNEDTYTVDTGALMTLTVSDTKGTEAMTQGSATYTANADSPIFHFTNSDNVNNTYSVYGDATVLKIVFEGADTQTLVSISGQGTRAATTYDVADAGMTYTYQSDTYKAIAGSSTILFNATGTPSTASETIFTSAGSLINNVSNTGVFHFNPNSGNDWYAYTAGNDVDITLSLTDSVQSFSTNPNGTRTASETTFIYSVHTYTVNDGSLDTYYLTTSATSTSIVNEDLIDTLLSAEGYRTIEANDSYTSKLTNTYTLTEGTYSINVTGGSGTDTLTAGAGTRAYDSLQTFYYGTESDKTSYTANIEGATLQLSVADSSETETLISGAAWDGANAYIMANDAKVTVKGGENATLSAVDPGAFIELTVEDFSSSTFTGGVTNISGSATGLTATLGAGGSVGIKGKLFSAESQAVLTADSTLKVFTATAEMSAEGNFTTDNVTLANKQVGISDDSDVAVFFNSSSVTKIEKLSDGASIGSAAGATNAITDSEGKFIFVSATETDVMSATNNTQTFNITGDESVIFQLDDAGLVTGIAGLNVDGSSITIAISDTQDESIVVSSTGMALTRNATTGQWTQEAVTAASYLVSLGSGGTTDDLTVYAIDKSNNLNKVENSRIISSSSSAADAINLTISGNDNPVTDIPVYVVNKSEDKVINVSGAATISGIATTSDTAAVQLTATNGRFIASTISAGTSASFGDNTTYGLANGQFSIDAAGKMAVEASSSAAVNVTMSANDTVGFVATETATSSFAVNGSETPVTLSIGEDDEDGLGMFTANLTGSELTGLTPHGVETGTAVVATSNDTVTSTTFAIEDATVTVTGDNDSDGMTLEIENDKLIGLSNISTDATINVSGLADGTTTLDVDGSPVTLQSDGDSIAPIKFNTTKDEWTSGSATSIEGATGYLVSVNADGNVELYYTNAEHTDTTRTTNVADYEAVLSGTAPTEDGEAVAYGEGLIVNGNLSDKINVSVAAHTGGITVTKSASGDDRELALVTANGNYTINGQEIIPTSAINVTTQGETAVDLILGSTVTVGSHDMNLSADSDSAATFGSTIYLNDTAKVTNTANDVNFNVTGNVAFDGIVVKAKGVEVSSISAAASLTVSGAGLTVGDKDVNVIGDGSYTVDVTDKTPTISGINGGSTISGALSSDAKIITASTGAFKIDASAPFTIVDDSDVTFTAASSSVTAIDDLNGTATGDFSNGVSIDGDHSVLILNDDLVGITANGTQVTDIDGVGSASTDVVIANAGGASMISTNLNGSIYFGADNATTRKHYNVTDADAQVSFLTGSTADYVPTVSGVTSLSNGSIAISQDETGFGINSDKISLGGVSNDVTVAVADSSISTVLGLEGSVNGLSAGVFVNAVDSDVTINGAVLQVVEPTASGINTNLTVEATASGFDTVRGLNNNASVTTARNAHVITEEIGAFTFVDDTFTISGDESVTFVTDNESRVQNIADFAGTLKSTAEQVTVNGAAFGTSNTDASIVSAANGQTSVVGLNDGDSVTVPNGVAVQMPGTSSTNTDTAITINGKTYRLAGDTDGVEITPSANGIDAISTLAPNASLTVGAAGNYSVNDEALNASIGAVIIGDVEGAAHVYSPDDITFDSETNTDTIIQQITGQDPEERYVENLDTDAAATLATAMARGDLSEANGNIQMAASNSDTTTTQTLDFSGTTGIKKVTLESGAQDVSFNDAGGNIAIVSSGVEGTKNINLGNGGDLAVVNDTGLTPVNIRTGRGNDTIVTKGRAVSINMSAGGQTRVMPTAGTVNMEGYDANTGAGIQLTNSNVALAVKTNSIKLQNGAVTVNGGAAVVTNPNAETTGSSIVNFYNLKGLMTKVGYTHDDGGTVDLGNESGDVVMKGNYTEGSAQRKGGGSTLVSGSGNDTAFGGAGDAFDLGGGDNTITMDTDRSLSEAGALVSQSATTGRTEVNNFHAEYGDTGDKVRINTAQATVKFVGGALRFMLGAATLILNAVSSSRNADLAESADGEDSKIGTVHSQKVMIEDSNDPSGSAIRMEVASAGSVINVERVDDVITQSYMGENSGVNLGTFDENAIVNLNAGEGMFNGEYVRLGGITKLQGGSGVDTLIGSGSQNNTLVAGLGGGSIWGGGASNDTMSGVGSTLESIKSASTSFFFMNGDGKDMISDFTFLNDETADTADRINVYTSGVTNVDVAGNDVIISLANEADKLTLKDAVKNGAGQDFRFDYVDGNGANQSLTAQVNTGTLNFDGRANYYQATGKNAAVNVNSELSSADIWLNNDGNFSNNTFVGDIKYLNASNIEGRTTLVGNGNDNYIVASKDNTSMWGGDQGGNDTLVGGDGADTFWYGKNNNGSDVITNIGGDDTINLYDIALDDISTADISSNEVAITLKDGQTLKVQGNVTAGTNYRLTDGAIYAVDSNRNWYQKN